MMEVDRDVEKTVEFLSAVSGEGEVETGCFVLSSRKHEDIPVNEIFSQGISADLNESVEAVMRSIKAVGRLFYPLLVREATDKERELYGKPYVVLDGRRRLEALRRLGYTHAPCLVVSSSGMEDAKAVLATNIVRSDNPWTAAYYVHQLRRLGMTRKEVAEAIGCSEKNITRYESLFRLDVRIQSLVRAGYIPYRLAYRLAPLRADEQEFLAGKMEAVVRLLTQRGVSEKAKKKTVSRVARGYLRKKRVSSGKKCSRSFKSLVKAFRLIEQYVGERTGSEEIVSVLQQVRAMIVEGQQ